MDYMPDRSLIQEGYKDGYLSRMLSSSLLVNLLLGYIPCLHLIKKLNRL